MDISLTVIIEIYEHKVIGCSISTRLSTEQTVIPLWLMTARIRPINQLLIFHSDRGNQYACYAFYSILESNNLIPKSISRKGNCWDNAVTESFSTTIKVEWIYSKSYTNQQKAQLSIFEWIESWYNRKRRHSALGYKTTDEFVKINSIFKNAT